MKNAHTHLKGHAHFWLLLKRKLPSRIIEGRIIEFSTVLRYLVTIVQSCNNNMNTCNNYSYLIFGPGAHAVCPQSHCPAQDLFSIATVIILPGQVWHDDHNARHQWGPTQHSLTGCGIKICYTDESSFSNQLDRFPKCVVYICVLYERFILQLNQELSVYGITLKTTFIWNYWELRAKHDKLDSHAQSMRLFQLQLGKNFAIEKTKPIYIYKDFLLTLYTCYCKYLRL